MNEPIEPIAKRGRDNDLVFPAEHRRDIGDSSPGGCPEVGVLLEGEPGGRGQPGNHNCVGRGQGDAQRGCVGSLHHTQQAPKTTLEGEVAAAHGSGIRLTNGAADDILSVAAGAPAGIDGVPVDAVLLGESQ